MRKYKVLDNKSAAQVTNIGDTVFEFIGYDYGCARTDTTFVGETCISVTEEEGKSPFFTIPIKDLEEITG